MSYQLFIKGQKEPLEINTDQADKLIAIFNDRNTEAGFVINVANCAFKKSEIRMIKQGGEAKNYNHPHWIIVNRKRNCIWKEPYTDYKEAKTEFELQIKLLMGRSHGFALEYQQGSGTEQEKTITEIGKSASDREFDKLVEDASNKLTAKMTI